MGKQRAGLNLDMEDMIDIEELAVTGKPQAKQIDTQRLEQVAQQSGFTSRAPQKPRRRRKKSPYTAQLGIKIRPQMKALFQDIGQALDIYDHTTLEYAILALLEKKKMVALLQQYKDITK